MPGVRAEEGDGQELEEKQVSRAHPTTPGTIRGHPRVESPTAENRHGIDKPTAALVIATQQKAAH